MDKHKTSRIVSSIFIAMLIFSLFTPAFSAAGKFETFENKNDSSEKLEKMKEIVQEHESLLEKEPTIHPSLLNKRSGDAEVSVIIQFSEAPVALAKGKMAVQQQTFSIADEQSAKNRIQAQQKGFEKFTKTNNISFTKRFSFDTVLNGMSGNVSTSDLEKLLEVPGILSIEPNSEVYALESPTSDDTVDPQMDQTVPHLDVPELWERGITGEGVKVAVLDTGIDYDHPDLIDVYKGGYNFIKHDAAVYTEERDEDDPYETYPSERVEGQPEVNDNGSTFYTSHGTHVAGTIAAQGENEYGIKGIAPDIDLYAYRVLGAYGSGFMDGIIEAIGKSVEEDMDIINLSLGGGSNNEYSADTVAINNAALEGVTSVIATGNSGPNRGSVGNPATAALAISVGNSTAPEELKSAGVQIIAGEYANQSQIDLMAWTYGSDPEVELKGDFEIVAIPGFGESTDFDGIDVEGKIALISRGEIAFVDKIAAAKDAGAVGTLIHNNTDAGPSDVFLSTAFEFIPSFDMATTEGNELREALENNTGTVAFGNFKSTHTVGNEMSESSSQGPSTPNFDIKPDVVAPGSNIMSTVPAYKKDFPDANFDRAFDRASGTSMATPHVAAIAALVKSENPDFDPFDIKVALSNTAKLLDTDKYDVFVQGAGLVQPVAAVDAGAYAYVLDTAISDDETIPNEKGTITFGNIEPDPDEIITLTKAIDLRNRSDDASNYEITVDVTKAATGAFSDARVTVDKSSIALGESEIITVSLEVPAGEAEAGNELLGYIHVTNGTTDLSLPFAAEFAGGIESEGGIEYFSLVDDAIAPYSDGSPSETQLEFKLLDNQAATFIELYDLTNEIDHIGFYLAEAGVPAGAWYIDIDENYFDLIDLSDQQAQDGVYAINMYTDSVAGQEYNELEAPFFIKSTNPEIDFNANDSNQVVEAITGTIDDQFVDFKSSVEEHLGIPYNVNEHLKATYEITNADGVVAEDETLIGDDGSFDVQLTELDGVDFTFTLFVEDRLGHTAEESITFPVVEEPETIEVTLSPSTTEPTRDPVTIEVATDSESALTSMKWLAGAKDVADFENDGEAIDIDASAFEVNENGIYTVYIKNENDTEAVGTININNIVVEDETFTIDLTPSPTEDTEGPVTIDVQTDSQTDLTALKWLQGEHDVDAFMDNGENIDVETMAFAVDENAIYTVFAENVNGVQEVQSITIANIVQPDANAFDLSFDLSPTEPTEGPVTITVDSNSEAKLTSLQWLPGVHLPEAFDEDGNEMDLEAKAFEVEENGYYTVFAENSEDTTTIAYVEVTNIIEKVEPTPFTVSLYPSTTEDTEGPVIVYVTHKSQSAITNAKWLEGKHSADDFADAGNTIDLESMSFEATENGTYSIFVENEEGVEVVELITIDNIKQPVTEPEPEPIPEPIAVEFELSKEDPTVEPITVTVHADSKAEITEAKWLEGRKSLDEVKENGNAIGLDTMSFVVTKNGTYSVYLQNSDGTEVLTTITITNIIKEDVEDPDKPITPGDPANPNPCIPCDDEDDDKDKGTGGNGNNNGGQNNGNNNGGKNGSEVVNSGKGGKGGVSGKQLPKTATNTFNIILFGTILTIIGGLSLYVVYRRKKDHAIELE